MPRPPRIQFPGANYHVVTRGDGKRPIFHDEGHYERLTTGLADEIEDPLTSALAQWVIGSEDFLKRVVALAEKQDPTLQGRLIPRVKAVTIQETRIPFESFSKPSGTT